MRVLVADALQLLLELIGNDVRLLLPGVGDAVQVVLFLPVKLSQLLAAAVTLAFPGRKHVLELLDLAGLFLLLHLQLLDLPLHLDVSSAPVGRLLVALLVSVWSVSHIEVADVLNFRETKVIHKAERLLVLPCYEFGALLSFQLGWL